MEKLIEKDLQELETTEETLEMEEIKVEELAIDGICGVY